MIDFVMALKLAKEKFHSHPHWRRLEGTPWENDAPVIAATLMTNAQRAVTKDDICEITGKHVEAADPGDRYCPCATCQAYLRRITNG